jgi:Transcriptional regulators
MRNKKIDKTELAIVGLLQDGRKSYKEIGQVVGLSEATVRSKVNRLIQERLVEIKALVSTKNLEPGYLTAYVGIRLKSPIMKKTAEGLSKLPGVISVALVTGRFDLFLTVMLTPQYELIDFFNLMLEKHSDEVSSHETFLAYESVNLKTPYPY